MWTWISKEGKARKDTIWKGEYFVNKGIDFDEIPFGCCWCCQFDKIVGGLLGKQRCVLCPIEKWGENEETCIFGKSIYSIWCKETDWQKSADLAERIANLPFKKVFDITPKQAELLRKKGYGEIYSREER